MSNYVYETKTVKSSKTTKYCRNCSKTIKIGEPSFTVVYHTDDGFQNAHTCSKKCEKEYISSFDEEDNGEDD